ncbi:MAG TPA: hypothetical protein PLH56_03790 [Candidatus Omnitrophota bacterium]|nr:hypothetical protein [Candidatus Omnitrophota bacterium]HPN88438.1 hypothetical protein [Candidatus Omnitrophota bacterium]
MKRVIFKNKKDYEKGTKELSLCQKIEDQDSITHITKRFFYHVTEIKSMVETSEAPQIYIVKNVDSKKKLEQVDLKCVGSFYMTHQRTFLKVNFQHTLNIQIYWKTDIFSPKKSAILT